MADETRESYDLYNGLPPHVRGSDTSIAAAISVRDLVGPIRSRILAYINRCGEHGATDEEVEYFMKLRHQSASARRRELVLMGDVTDSERRRKTSSGRKAAVWVSAELVSNPISATPHRTRECQEARELLDLIAMEFRTDPMSVQCFDKRTVERVIVFAKQHPPYHWLD